MTEHRILDAAADVLPVGLQPTPFGEVWQALQQVAAQVWDVDPSVYRAGIAWMWYALRNPVALDADGLRPLLVAALISEQAPLVKDTQTVAELAEYLRLWRGYTPTYPKLEALYSVFAARVEVRPISDAESQGVLPVADRRLAFYLRVEDFDAARPLTLEEVYQIAVRATPLGSRPVPYFALVGSSDVFAGPASAGLVRALWASEPAAAPPMSFVVVDGATGAIVHGFNQALEVYELPSVVLNSEDGYETYELPSIPLAAPKMVIGVPISGPVQAFWFTDEGRDETNDKTFTVVGNPLFDEDGSATRNELYERSVPLSFMQYDGNMFEADSDSDIVRYLPTTNRLTLSIPGDSTTRGKSAWSVQCAKLFVLSYANTQLPDVQIELPINEVGTYGTSITLPTIDGEYESGGKTWKPSAWDIGAFGSSYTLNADTVAHLIFEEVQQYQEITLYMQSGNKQAQKQVTSGFTGNVNATYCYQLYVDDQLTTPWTGYDYSNDYELGNYSDGVWIPWTRTSVSSLPDTYTSDSTQWKMAFILMDNGFLWIASNVSGSGYMSYPSGYITLRIYPKEQQWIPVFPYNPSYGEYDNLTTNRKGTFVRKGSPATVFGTFPAIAESFGYKSGMIKSASIQAEFQISQAVLYLNVVGNPSLSNIVVRFENDIYTGYVRSDKADLPTSPSYDGATYTLKDDNGNDIDYDDSFTYKFVLLLDSTGNAVGGASATGSMRKSSTGKLQVRIRYSSSKFNRVWYYRIPIS